MVSEAWQRIKALAAKGASKVSSAAWPVLLVCAIVLFSVLMFGSITAIVGSPMGILVADETNDPNSIPIATIVQEINAEFEASIAAEIAAHPECDEVKIHYLYPDGQTWRDFWPEILALYAADANMNRGETVMVLNAESKNRIREIFWQMHSIDAVVEVVGVPTRNDPNEETIEESETDGLEDLTEDQSPMYSSVLNISVHSKTIDQICMLHGFSREQIDIMIELLRESIWGIF